MATSTVDRASRSLPLEERSSYSKRIYVGNDRVYEVFKAAIDSAGSLREKVEVVFDPLTIDMNSHAVFGRDLRVTLLDGSQLIPYQMKQVVIRERMQSWFPIRDLINDVPLTTGFGFDSQFEGKALEAARREGIEHTQSKTTIEGGNCFVFEGADRRPRAIVGINSLILSLLSLEEQDYFTKNREDLVTRVASPSDEFVLMARDRILFDRKAALENDLITFQHLGKTDPTFAAKHREACDTLRREYGPSSEYKARLRTPLSPADRASFHELGKELQAKWEMAKELIAEELKLPFEKGRVDESLAVIFQNDFHIDLEMFVSPKGKVFMNDETLVQKTCSSTRVSSYYSHILDRYTRTSTDRLSYAQYIKALNAPILARIGCEVVYVPGSYHAEGPPPVNFMNGLSIKDGGESYFITFGASDRITGSFQDCFAESVARQSPELRLIFLGSVSDLFKMTGGGLHCMTWEKL